jgi:hypothetical protein
MPASHFTGAASDREIRDAAAFASEVYQPQLRVLLATLGHPDVQQRLVVEVGALTRAGGAR